VTTAQSAALSDEVTAVNILGRRMVDAVTLVQALGGGWNTSELPQRPECCGKLAMNQVTRSQGLLRVLCRFVRDFCLRLEGKQLPETISNFERDDT